MSKIKDPRNTYQADLARLAHSFLLIVSCPGGRPIVKGYVCTHCGMDTSHGDCAGVRNFKKKRVTK
jgi:hypothetical protein